MPAVGWPWGRGVDDAGIGPTALAACNLLAAARMAQVSSTALRAASVFAAACSLGMAACSGGLTPQPSAVAEQEIAALQRLTATMDATDLTLLSATRGRAGSRFQWQFSTAESATTYCHSVEQRLAASYICDERLSRVRCFRILGDEQLDLELHAQTSREKTLVWVSAEVAATD